MGTGEKNAGGNLQWTRASHPGGVTILLVGFMLRISSRISSGSVGKLLARVPLYFLPFIVKTVRAYASTNIVKLFFIIKKLMHIKVPGK